MRRRDFITRLSGAAVVWPLAARAQQQAKIPEIGFLDTSPGPLSEFRTGLMEAGYTEGRNVKFRFGNVNQSLEQVARELVNFRVDVIVALGGVRSLLAAKAATSTIPIVYKGGADPVKLGIAASLNRPGGNITGITVILNALAGKRLDLLVKLVPNVATIGYMIGDRVEGGTDDLLEAARSLGRKIIVLECRSPADIDNAFTTMTAQGTGGVLVGAFPVAFNNRGRVLALAAGHRLPAIYAQAPYVYEGGLMSYMPSGAGDRQLAIQYVARILKGMKPADLPIQQPTKFELTINLTTARALGLTIPATIELLIDKTVE
jgi:putative ABC transport system substrate-binding protein